MFGALDFLQGLQGITDLMAVVHSPGHDSHESMWQGKELCISSQLPSLHKKARATFVHPFILNKLTEAKVYELSS